MKALRFLLVILALVFISVEASRVIKCYVCNGSNVKDIPKLCTKTTDCGKKDEEYADGNCRSTYFKGGAWEKACETGNWGDYCGRGEGPGSGWWCICSKDKCNMKEKDHASCTACEADWNATFHAY